MTRRTHHHAKDHREALARELVPVLAVLKAFANFADKLLLRADPPGLTNRPRSVSLQANFSILLFILLSGPVWIELVDVGLVNTFAKLLGIQLLAIRAAQAALPLKEALASEFVVVERVVLAGKFLVARMHLPRIRHRPGVAFEGLNHILN